MPQCHLLSTSPAFQMNPTLAFFPPISLKDPFQPPPRGLWVTDDRSKVGSQHRGGPRFIQPQSGSHFHLGLPGRSSWEPLSQACPQGARMGSAGQGTW